MKDHERALLEKEKMIKFNPKALNSDINKLVILETTFLSHNNNMAVPTNLWISYC
jgi:hypothetical protein